MLVSSFGPFPGEFTSSHFERQETCYQWNLMYPMPKRCWTHSVGQKCQGVPLPTCKINSQRAVKWSNSSGSSCPFWKHAFFFALPACKAKAKYQLALAQGSVSLSNLCATCPLSSPHPLTDFHVWKCNSAVKWLKHQNSEAPERIGDLLWSTTDSKVLCQIHQGQKTSQRKCFWHGGGCRPDINSNPTICTCMLMDDFYWCSSILLAHRELSEMLLFTVSVFTNDPMIQRVPNLAI